MSSVTDLERLEWLEEIGVKRHKIASDVAMDVEMCKAIISKEKPTLISDGHVRVKEIWPAGEEVDHNNLLWLYCVSEYPADLDKIEFIEYEHTTFASTFLTPHSSGWYDGFSDHTIGISASVVAMSLGARIIEKHFTLYKGLPGPDHVCSASPRELKQLCEVRDDIDERIKRILYAQGYKEEDLAISASYPLGRMVVQYENHEGLNDSYMIEVGYMRRIPVLHKDIIGTFRHLGTGESIPIKTPEPDELYANKWCTLLYRRSSRDLFDVYMFSKKGFRQDTFRICALIDSLMRGQPKLYEIDVEEVVESIPVDSALRNLLLKDISQYEFDEMREDVKEFSQEMIRQLTVDERSVIDRFYDDRKFNPEPIDPDGVLNMRIRDHPLIRWALKKL